MVSLFWHTTRLRLAPRTPATSSLPLPHSHSRTTKSLPVRAFLSNLLRSHVSLSMRLVLSLALLAVLLCHPVLPQYKSPLFGATPLPSELIQNPALLHAGTSPFDPNIVDVPAHLPAPVRPVSPSDSDSDNDLDLIKVERPSSSGPVTLPQLPLVPPPQPHPVHIQGLVYDAFAAPAPRNAIAELRVRPIRDHAAISTACLDAWVASGKWNEDCGTLGDSRIDFVYVWVNGSNPLHEQSRSELLGETMYKTKQARFREHDELRYSVRSVRDATAGWSNTTIHLITADVADPRMGDASHRLGLVPQWLDAERAAKSGVGEGEPRILVHHDTQLFRLTAEPGVQVDAEDAAQWLAKVIPSFNSQAIESQLHNLNPDFTSDNLITMNDDQFLTMPTPPASYHTPLYGPVFRLYQPRVIHGFNDGRGSGHRESRSQQWSAFLLDQRFGKRGRAYIRHNARSLTLPHLHEAALAFGQFFANTPLSQFRGSHNVKGEWEVNTIFLTTHYVIERHREALLWSWIVGKWGQRAERTGYLDPEMKREMWHELGGEGKERINKGAPRRTTMQDVPGNLVRAGVQPPGPPEKQDQLAHTAYHWVSAKGFSPGALHPMDVSLSRDKCMGPDGESSWDMFRRLLMTPCGSNVIAALIHTSTAGLDVFLPDPNLSNHSTSPSYHFEAEPIILPLVLPDIAPALPTNPRAFAVRLIQRYAYVIGESPTLFSKPETPEAVRGEIHNLRQRENVAMWCLNDDLSDDPEQLEEADSILKEFFEERWPEQLECDVGPPAVAPVLGTGVPAV